MCIKDEYCPIKKQRDSIDKFWLKTKIFLGSSSISDIFSKRMQSAPLLPLKLKAVFIPWLWKYVSSWFFSSLSLVITQNLTYEDLLKLNLMLFSSSTFYLMYLVRVLKLSSSFDIDTQLSLSLRAFKVLFL